MLDWMERIVSGKRHAMDDEFSFKKLFQQCESQKKMNWSQNNTSFLTDGSLSLNFLQFCFCFFLRKRQNRDHSSSRSFPIVSAHYKES